MLKAVFWDNDGVLVDTEAVFFTVTRAAFAAAGLELTKEIWGRQYLGDGRSSREIALDLGADPERIKAVVEARNERYREALQTPPPVRPQVRRTLAALHGQVRMAIVTGCRREMLALAHAAHGLLPFFETIVTGDDCTQPKPHPDLYLAGLKRLGIPPEECLAIEDSPRGLASARAAGIPCIVVPTDLTAFLEFPGAVCVAPDVSEVLTYALALDVHPPEGGC